MAHFLTSSFGYIHHEATPSCCSFVAETGVISLLLCYADHVIELSPKDFHLPVDIYATFFFVSTDLVLKSTTSTNNNTPSLSALG